MSGDVLRRRLIARGDLPGSNGGIYNPGAVLTEAGIVLLCRREVDYRFRRELVFPELVTLDPASLDVIDHRTLIKVGYPLDTRVEDFRTILFAGEHLAVHTTVDDERIKPEISRVGADVLERVDPLILPIALDPVEKNWVLFEHEHALHCLYKLDPLTIFRREADGAWRLVKEEHNGWSMQYTGTLSNSATLIPFDDGYLGFWHTILEDRYVQGAFLLDDRLSIRYRTGVLLDGADVIEGHKPGVLYVSGLVDMGERVLAFYGEADAHTSVAIFDRGELAAELRRHPFTAVRPLRVRLAGQALSDAMRALHALDDEARIAGRRRVHLFVGEPGLRSVVAGLVPPHVVVMPDQPALEVDATLPIGVPPAHLRLDTSR